MNRILRTLTQFLLISFMAAGLAGCPGNVQPTKELSPIQDAYVVRDSIIVAKRGMQEALAYGKISRATYDRAWMAAEDADRIVVAQIKAARDGLVVKSEVDAATKKVDEAKAIGGVQ